MSQWGISHSFRAYMRHASDSGATDQSRETGGSDTIAPHDRDRADVDAYLNLLSADGSATSGRGLEYLYPSPFGQEARTQLPLFEDETGIQVREHHTPPDSVGTQEAYSEVFKATDAAFDVGHMDVVWPGEFASNGWVSPIRDRHGHSSDMIRTATDAVTVDGEMVAMPFYTDVNVLFYNERKLAEHGYTKPPDTESELVSIAQDILAKDDEVDHGYLWQGEAHEGLTVMWFNWLWGRGGSVWENDRIVVDTVEGVDALRHAVNLLHIHDISPAQVLGSFAHDNRYEFAEGRSLFMRHWPKAVSLLNSGTAVAEDFDVTTLPTHEDHPDANNACLGGWNLFVASDAPNPNEAQELVDWMATEDVQRRLALDYSRLPVRETLYDDDEVRDAFEAMSVFEEALKQCQERPPIPQYPEFSEILYTECHAALQQDKTPGQALADAQAAIDTAINT
jgi:ABC-type glycerol-3-phosphate transport system substrate-binding protein